MVVAVVTGGQGVANRPARSWNPRAAAAFLDSRTKAWTAGGGMDHGTFCISCHTALPYAIARPAMHSILGEAKASSVEQTLLESVRKRVVMWDSVLPYLGDKFGGTGTESVINALVLAQSDSTKAAMSATTRQALRIMWEKQIKSGDRAGSWPWINAGNEPWEAPDSEFWGATLAAVATAIAPDAYLAEPSIQVDLNRLKSYLRKREPDRSLLNRLGLLWAATKLPGLIPVDQRTAIVSDVLARQQPDGGWSTASLIPATWSRHDRTAQETRSDGYGTGTVAFILEQSGVRARSMNRALDWLAKNQDRVTGAWPTVSPNATRDPSTDVGKFMTDAATAYASLALVNGK